MENDFWDWLDECPVQWFLKDENSDQRTYIFIDNTKEIKED